MLEFDRREGVVYEQRPGVYAVIVKDGRVAVVQLPQGAFLPGGGADPGEAPEETLRREVREEIGHEVHDLVFVGEAAQYITPRSRAPLCKPSRFYRASLGACVGRCEPEHELVWLEPEVAAVRLRDAAQGWAVRQATRS